MKIARLASLMLVAILAIGLVVASVAVAEPEFTPVGATVTGTSGTGKLVAVGETVTCAKDTSTGTVTSATLLGNVVVHFLECTGKTKAGVECPAHSEGAPLTNLILTKTLHGVLGLILPKPTSGSGVALVLLPVKAPEFVTLEGTCLVTTSVTGDVAGLVEPVGTSTTKGTLTLLAEGEHNKITDVDLSTGGLISPRLKAFGLNASEETTEVTTFSTATTVT